MLREMGQSNYFKPLEWLPASKVLSFSTNFNHAQGILRDTDEIAYVGHHQALSPPCIQPPNYKHMHSMCMCN